jgi:ATP-dependent Clp protease ATP-binding subunit ClpA
VVFDFIRAGTARKIFDRMMDNLLFRLKDSYKIQIDFEDDSLERIAELACADLSMGGRGIGGNLEVFFMNPLSRRLCELHDAGGATYVVRGISQTQEGWELDMG